MQIHISWQWGIHEISYGRTKHMEKCKYWGIHLISYVRFPTAFVRITYHIHTIWLLHICSHVSLLRKRSPTLMNRHSILLSLSYSASSCKNSFGHRVNTMIELVTSHNIPTFVIISEKEAPWIPLRKIGRLRRRNWRHLICKLFFMILYMYGLNDTCVFLWMTNILVFECMSYDFVWIMLWWLLYEIYYLW